MLDSSRPPVTLRNHPSTIEGWWWISLLANGKYSNCLIFSKHIAFLWTSVWALMCDSKFKDKRLLRVENLKEDRLFRPLYSTPKDKQHSYLQIKRLEFFKHLTFPTVYQRWQPRDVFETFHFESHIANWLLIPKLTHHDWDIRKTGLRWAARSKNLEIGSNLVGRYKHSVYLVQNSRPDQ